MMYLPLHLKMKQRSLNLCNIIGCTLLNGIIMISYSSFNIISYYVQFINMFIGLHMIDNRYLHILKSYVRNRTYLEGSIVEGYLIE